MICEHDEWGRYIQATCGHPAEQRVWQSNWQFTCEKCKAIVRTEKGAIGGDFPL